MINELYELAEAMQQAGIKESVPAQNYPTLARGMCICVSVKEGCVTGFRSVDANAREVIRKYGVTSKGFYPCVKLAPLYHVFDKDVVAVINKIKKKPELISDAVCKQLSDWCIECNNNWDNKVIARYDKSLNNVSKELRVQLAESPYEPLEILAEETDRFGDFMCFHEALTEASLQAIAQKRDVELALTLLFACPSKKGETKDSFGELSILFDTERLIECGMPPVTGSKFSEGLNTTLLISQQKKAGSNTTDTKDAFAQPYTATDAVMPEIKLGAGFSVKIRAMNKDVPCQHRYGRSGSYTFPASVEVRQRLAGALAYISKDKNRGKTWLKISDFDGKPQDVLFAYPLELQNIPQNFASVFQRPKDRSISFLSRAQRFLSQLQTPRDSMEDTCANGIRIFILHRINVKNNSGRAKVVYTRQTDSHELEKQSELWTEGCLNLPNFTFGQPSIPFPLDVADILNCFWNQKGELITKQFKPVPKHHGVELLMDSRLSVTADLHCLSGKAMIVGESLERKLVQGDFNSSVWDEAKDILALIGLMLHRKGIGKDRYMKDLPYLYGQLLKVSDELHALYCKVVRDGKLPAQLAGGSLYQAAAEAPVRTLNLLGQRMNPYILWAKTYRTKNISKPGEESWKAGWLISLYENIATELFTTWSSQTRFNDEEKAQLFLGYLAKFSKKEQTTDGTEDITNVEEVDDHE